ncbi:hypothetical protein LPB140_01630 [Sphingorhabdus lutea]|uniref:EamA domain-containing protein n=1 Tax=Sphingorhabdus lutea TaxID=1913578 RepID=A0A1L3J9E6_9SPHN|nr:DMT family transporter [Sphingorhabdus lutea]APG61744.1 hypothetical protein LPB140_01630 [Sphingorhabdus lutea]
MGRNSAFRHFQGQHFNFLILLIGNVALALGPLFVRMADTGPTAAAFWRMALPLPIFALYYLYLRRRRKMAGNGTNGHDLPFVGEDGKIDQKLGKKSLFALLLAGLFFAADLTSWHAGIMLTKLGNSAIFGNCASLFLVIYAIFISRQWPRPTQILAILFAFLGALLLMGQSLEISPQNFRGDILSLLAGILYAGYMISLIRVRQKMDSFSVLFLVSIFSAIPLLIITLLLGEKLFADDWTALVALAICSQIIGQGCLIYSMSSFSSLVIGLVLLMQPVVSALTGLAIYGEVVTGLDIVGAAMVMAALVLVRMDKAPIKMVEALPDTKAGDD